MQPYSQEDTKKVKSMQLVLLFGFVFFLFVSFCLFQIERAIRDIETNRVKRTWNKQITR